MTDQGPLCRCPGRQSSCISQKTVENHRASIMRKLDLHTTMDLVRYAAKFGMIDLDRWRNRKES